MTVKICSKCKIKKLQDKFYKDSKTKDGLTYWCADCNRANARNDYHTNRKARRLKNKLWAAVNKDRRNEYRRERRKDPNVRERMNLVHREYIAKNKEKKRLRDAAYYEKNKEREQAKARARYQANPDVFKESARRRKNRIKSTVQAHYTRQQIYDRDTGLCFKCSEMVDLALKHPDPMYFSFQHAIPLILGGHDTPENVLTSHLICNLKQGTKPFTITTI